MDEIIDCKKEIKYKDRNFSLENNEKSIDDVKFEFNEKEMNEIDITMPMSSEEFDEMVSL